MYKLGIIGGGKMGEALLSGALKKGLYEPGQIILSESSEARKQVLERSYGIQVSLDNRLVAAEAETLLLAVKPKIVADVLSQVADCLKPGTALISIAAGVGLEAIESMVPAWVGVVRTMPNIAVSVGEGMTGIARGKNATDAQMEMAEGLFGSVGRVAVVDEANMDAVTGLSGSGPAYIFMVIEALADGGVKVGLPRDIAIRLAAQTVLGAAKTVLETGEHPAALKDQVTTPGGTTIEGILELEAGGLRATLINSVVKGTERSRQLLRKT